MTAQNKYFLMFTKKKSEQKLLTVKEEPTIIDNIFCGYCLTFVYTVHIKKSCSCKQEITKTCTNCAEDKKACTSVSSELQKKVTVLLSDYNNFLRLKNVILQEKLKASMVEQATSLNELLAKMALLSV
ncbi:uncharacterized protein CIMG_13210 [Coccidioides immitis RS]|uniref:Uncharacterized protein n=1 Tax=Coccidioides immitis (strain RS) TaxID=246410 RepID=A0A0D8JUH6_COCIM|nr:uncharacterized protein CIMG_13210 [Coccidioides immitis RS]KJF60774.1 hypothetical protein CIMG_13210 [Coccidioides immitis RS]